MKLLVSAFLILVMPGFAWPQSPDIVVAGLIANPLLRNANTFLERDQRRTTSEMVSLESPDAAARFAELLKSQKLSGVDTDHWGSVTGVRESTNGAPLIVVAAHLTDARALAVLLATSRALDSQQIRTGMGLLLLGLADRHAATERPGLDYVLRDSSYKERIRGLVMLETRAPDHVSMTSRTIDSPIVQSVLESIKGLGMTPYSKEESTDRESAVELKIPSISIGCGYATARGNQAVLTMILAIAGLGQSR